jgi:hypothetical protein
MKRWKYLLLLVILTFSLTSCRNSIPRGILTLNVTTEIYNYCAENYCSVYVCATSPQIVSGLTYGDIKDYNAFGNYDSYQTYVDFFYGKENGGIGVGTYAPGIVGGNTVNTGVFDLEQVFAFATEESKIDITDANTYSAFLENGQLLGSITAWPSDKTITLNAHF